MRKMRSYNEYATIKCQCGRPLKIRMLLQKIHIPVCFKCYQNAVKGTDNPIVTAKEVRTGKIPGRKKGIYGLNS